MRIQLLIEFLNCPRAFLFLLYSLGVFGVGSELVTYLPDSMDPPFLDVMPKGIATGATLPLQLAPALAFSIISCIFILRIPMLKFAHSHFDQLLLILYVL